jgi:hypothetical protein
MSGWVAVNVPDPDPYQGWSGDATTGALFTVSSSSMAKMISLDVMAGLFLYMILASHEKVSVNSCALLNLN